MDRNGNYREHPGNNSRYGAGAGRGKLIFKLFT